MRIQEIRLKTASIKALQDFYKDILLFEVSQTTENYFTVHAGKTDLVFENMHEEAFYHFAFNIPSNKLEEAYVWLKQRVKLLWLADYRSFIAEFADWHARSVYFYDPAGNIVEFIARFDLKDMVTAPFSPLHIRNVSEIGLVFQQNSFDEKVDQLLHNYPLHYFIKQPPMQQFRAVGDDRGLFIIVPEKRNWYPTQDRLSGIYPLSIRFAVDEKVYFFNE